MKEILIARTKQYWTYINRLSLIVRVNVVLNRTLLLLTVTDVSTTCAVVIFRVKRTWVLFRTTFTRTIKLNLLMKIMTPGLKPFTIQCTLHHRSYVWAAAISGMVFRTDAKSIWYNVNTESNLSLGHLVFQPRYIRCRGPLYLLWLHIRIMLVKNSQFWRVSARK